MRGLDVNSPLFRTKVQLKLCFIQSNMGKHEEALDNCDTAVRVRTNPPPGQTVPAFMQKEAYLTRAEALLLDMDYDEAVNDFRAANDLVDDGAEEKQELNMKLRQAMQQQELWNGGKKDHNFNEHRGFPDGRPPERDHAKILGLPVNLEEHNQEIKCKWLKKQFKLLVRKWHPDKNRGDPKRASRKFKEVTDAKNTLSGKWECK